MIGIRLSSEEWLEGVLQISYPGPFRVRGTWILYQDTPQTSPPITHLAVVERPSLVWLTCDVVKRDRMVTVSRGMVFDDASTGRNGNDLDENGRDDDDDMGDVVAAAGPRVAVISPPVTRTSGLPPAVTEPTNNSELRHADEPTGD